MENYQEFLNKLQKQGSKPHTISHCLGARDAWKWVRKNKWKVLKGQKCSSALYGALIMEVNKLLVEELFEGHLIEFPHNMGTLMLTGTPAKLRYKEGKLYNNYRTDWEKTLKYWFEDDEARKNKQVIKRVQNTIYNIKYSKRNACYKNQRYYHMRINRSLVRALGKKIKGQKLNALIL